MIRGNFFLELERDRGNRGIFMPRYLHVISTENEFLYRLDQDRCSGCELFLNDDLDKEILFECAARLDLDEALGLFDAHDS